MTVVNDKVQSLRGGLHIVVVSVVALLFGSAGLLFSAVSPASAAGPTTFCNENPITVPAAGTEGVSAPYPSTIAVSGMSGTISDVTVTLQGLSHGTPVDLDILLAAPDETQNLVLMSDVGGTGDVSGLQLVFDDAAREAVPMPPPTSALTSGTYRPTNLPGDDEIIERFPSPAPTPTDATTLSTFDGSDPNGTWSLYINDDHSGDRGSIADGWCLTVRTPPATATALNSSRNPSSSGDGVTFTAAVTVGGTPVTTGTVTFSDNSTPVASGVPLASDGTATFSTAALSSGIHLIAAAYSGTTNLEASTGLLAQVVNPFADAGGPYSVAEGGALTLDGSGSTAGASLEWDLNGDGNFSDAAGVAPTLSWADLQALGINDGPATHVATVRATEGGRTAAATADVVVTNAAPETVITGTLTATVGLPFTLKVGATDPSSADMADTFQYTIDWGDGSAIQSINGPADPPVTHTYTTAGIIDAAFTATDKDGGAGDPVVVHVQVDPAPTPPTTPPPPSTTTPPPATTNPQPVGPGGTLPSTGGGTNPLLLGAAVFTLAGIALLAGARRRRRVTP